MNEGKEKIQREKRESLVKKWSQITPKDERIKKKAGN